MTWQYKQRLEPGTGVEQPPAGVEAPLSPFYPTILTRLRSAANSVPEVLRFPPMP